MKRPFLALLVVLALTAAACGDSGGEGTLPASTVTTIADTVASTTTETLADAGFDPELTRGDVDCSEETLAGGDDVDFLTAHYVVDGRLGALCLGDENETLLSAWNVLAIITPQGQLSDLGVFGGFDSSGDGGEFFAFVVDLAFDGEAFLMAINLDEAEFDPDELALTMAHEFSHVFTALPSQMDRDIDSFDCDTYYSGEGCYYADSLMFEWVDLFWGDLADEIDPFSEATPEAGQQRCDEEPGFLGPYAATSPEEDFAEAFSAFVFQVPPFDDEVLQAKMDWFAAQPGLLEFQQRAEDAGLVVEQGLNFEQCGWAAERVRGLFAFA